MQTFLWALMNKGRLMIKLTVKCLNLFSGTGRDIKKLSFY